MFPLLKYQLLCHQIDPRCFSLISIFLPWVLFILTSSVTRGKKKKRGRQFYRKLFFLSICCETAPTKQSKNSWLPPVCQKNRAYLERSNPKDTLDFLEDVSCLNTKKLTSSVVFSDLDWRNVAIHLLCRKTMSAVPRPSSHSVVTRKGNVYLGCLRWNILISSSKIT